MKQQHYCKKKNKSSLFILPLIEDIPRVYFSDCINCYVAAEFAPSDNGTGMVYVAYDKSSIEAKYFTAPKSNRAIINKTRVSCLNNHPKLDEIVEIEDFFVYSFQLEEDYIHDIFHFLNGEYSKMRNTSKDKILSYYTGNLKLRSILYPTTKAKQEFAAKYGLDSIEDIKELYSKPNWERETFKLSNFLLLEE